LDSEYTDKIELLTISVTNNNNNRYINRELMINDEKLSVISEDS